MAKTFTCLCCRCRLPANPRVKNQRYCGKDGRQRQRKRKWQHIKMASDPDYRANQQDAYFEPGANVIPIIAIAGSNTPPANLFRRQSRSLPRPTVAKWTR